MITRLCRAISLLAGLMFSTLALAHTGLSEATPAADSVVATAPEHIDLVFNGPVKLIKFELLGEGHEMPTEFKPNTESMDKFRIVTPGMHPGKFTVNWAVIGADGHTVSNSFGFTVNPANSE